MLIISSVSFLDILVTINGNRLVTSVFYKPTDSHSYLLYSSSHPNHTKQSSTQNAYLSADTRLHVYSFFLPLYNTFYDDVNFINNILLFLPSLEPIHGMEQNDHEQAVYFM